VESARSNLVYQTMRLQRHEERLEHYQKQVDLCTIRAPHDGFVIYANKNENDVRIEEGTRVRQRQNLFYLPDLSDMEVQMPLHESVVDRIHDGMPARVRIEALPGVSVEGHVVSVALVPLMTWSSFGSDVRNYLGMVKLDSVPRGLLPGMSAEVEIMTGTRNDALVVPAEAVTIEAGEDVCYVAREEGLERRHVTVGSSTSGLLEVTEGLTEGEEVVLDPARNLPADSDDSESEPPPEPDSDKGRSTLEIPSYHGPASSAATAE
jgi:HlyD family secretion protein